MSKRRNIDKKIQKTIAAGRIKKLFTLAEKYALDGELNLSNRYVYISRKISMKYLVPIPLEYKRRFCKHCYKYLLPNVNSRFRIKKGKMVIYCQNCNKFTRIPFK